MRALVGLLRYLLLVVVSVTKISLQCTPTCDNYSASSLPEINSNTTAPLSITYSQSFDSQLRLQNETNVSVFTSRDTCGNTPNTFCMLTNIVHEGGGNYTANLSCDDLEGVLGKNVVLVVEMESSRVNNCHILLESFAFQRTPRVSKLSAELLDDITCIVTLEGCFPPCCGSISTIERVQFGEHLQFWPDPNMGNSCNNITFSMSRADSSTIYDERISPSLSLSEPPNVELILKNKDIDNLQNCFKHCIKIIDLGHDLIKLNYTRGCFSVNVTISPPGELLNSDVHIQSYKAQFTYCELIEEPSQLTIHIRCVGFNPDDTDIQEKIVLEISHSGVCMDTYETTIGNQEIVPCMDKRCQRVASFNLDLCLMLCVENVAEDDGKVSLCVNVAMFALQGPSLTSDNITVVLEVLIAMAAATGLRQVEAVTDVMDDLLHELQKQENLHLISETIGNSLMTVLDLALRKSERNISSLRINLAPTLLDTLESVIRVVSKGVKEAILSNFQYTGTNAIVLASIVLVNKNEDFIFPRQGLNITGVKMKVPAGVLCGQQDTTAECQTVVGSVITKYLPNYLDDSIIHGESIVNSLLLSTMIDWSGEYRNHTMIENNPITIYFTPTPLISNIMNETCVFWNPLTRIWSSAGIITADSPGAKGETICIATHLTSFAVLVDPESSQTTVGQRALSIVSYVGCAISLACLLTSLLIFLSFGKSLNKGVLLHIHIHFAISLSLALALFVIGIETATDYSWACTLIAALLHYLFLCVFCWMLAEGIMLYMLVVRVFGNATDKWYYLLLLGWGLPVPVVAVSLGIRHEHYGTENYCWLSNSNGTFWAFLGPMIAIIMINSMILVATVGSMLRSRRKFVGSKDSRNWRLALTAVKSTIILLPLLGLTWIIGPFSLLKNTDMFSWIFAILNSLQGLFFFLLHVLRNDKVYDTLKKFIRCIPASVMEKPYSLRGLSSNITLASAESVATASTSEGGSQLDCERVDSPPFNVRIYQRKTSEGSAISLSHPTVSVFKNN